MILFKSTKQKRWTAWLLAFLMTFSVMSQGLTQVAKAATGDKVFDLIEITDFHGTLQSADNPPYPVGAVLAKNIKDLAASNSGRTLILGGGDLYQGSPISNVLKGVPVQKALSNIGMEVTALGNHEFDWGLDTITGTTMKDAKYSMVCANLYKKGTSERVFAPYKVITKDGVKIAVIGAITTETPTIVLPANVANYDFKDPVTEINSVAKQIKDNKEADVVLSVIHEGNDGNNVLTGKVIDIANQLTNVNAVFGGHSHTELHTTAATSKIPVYIAKSNGKGYIDAKMTVSTSGTVTFAAPSNSDYVAIDNTNANGYKATNPVQDPEVKQIVDDAVKAVGPTFSEVIGSASQVLNRKQDAVPCGESYLGNWSADVVRNYAKADVGMQNNGGVRIDVPKGDITVGTLYYLMPFDNEINTVTATKAQLIKILEQAVADGGKGMQISGIKVTYDSTKVSLSRITNVTREDGSALPDTGIKIAAPDFVATGGDGFTAFNDSAVKATLATDHKLVRDAMIEDVRANKAISTKMNKRWVNAIQTISLVATSDVHGTVYPYDYSTGLPADQGLAKVASYVGNLRFGNPNVILVDNGDTIQGTPFSYYYDKIDTQTEYPMMKVMGAMKYDSWTLGNHEFNYGLDVLNRIVNDAKKENIHVLSSNTYNTSDNTNFVEPYIIKTFTVNGVTHKVGVLGMTTKTIPSWENTSNYKGLQFNDLVDQAKLWVPKMKAAGAEVVIATVHSGEEGATDTIPENQIKAIAQGVSGIDAIVAGHAHSVYGQHSYVNPDGKTVVVTEPGKNAQYVSQVDVIVNPDGSLGTISTKNVKMDNTIVADQDILTLTQPYQNKTLDYINTVIGKSTDAYSGANQTTQPNALMDLINKVQMQGAKTQLSIAAPLSASAAIPAGDVKIKDLMSVYVFENFLYGVKMNSKQLKDWMEYSVRYYQQVASPSDSIAKDAKLNIPDYNLDILYGATYDIDLTQPACTTDPTTGKVVAQGTGRIKNLKFNGKAVTDSDTFTVAINNYRFNGGGGFVKAAGLTIKDANGKDIVDPSLVTYDSAKALGDDGQVRNMMIKYVQDNKVLTPYTVNNWKITRGETSYPQTISIVGTSDLHGNIYPMDYANGQAQDQGLAKISTYVNGLRSANPNVMLVDAGDTIQGTALSYYFDKIDTSSEYPMMKVMGAMKYDTWTLGNHEFNYGLSVLNRVIGDAKKENINVLSANIYNTSDGKNFIKPYYVKTMNVNGKDIKVGVLGLTTKTIPNWENPGNYDGLKFEDLVEQAKKWVPIMKNDEKVDIVVATIHSGEESASDTIPENQVKAVATGVSGVDAIICGHAHSNITHDSFKNPDGKTVLVTEPGKYGQYVSQVDIQVAADGTLGAVSTKMIKMDNSIVADQAILDLAKPYQDKTIDYINTVIGKSNGDFSGVGQTTKDTAIMDLVNAVQKDGAGTQLSIAAPLSATATIPTNDVKIKDIMGVYVFENFLYGVKMNGKQLKDWMEYSVRYYKQAANANDPIVKDPVLNVPDYNLDQLSGASYDVDLTQPVCTTDPTTGKVVVQGTGRIKNLKYNGQLVKDTDVFTVAINNYRFNGGGGFVKAAGLTIKDANGKDVVDPSLVTYDSAKALGDDGQVRNMMIKYIQDNKTITPVVDNNWKLYTIAVEQQVEATEIKLDKTSIALEEGKTETLTATVLPEKAINKNVTWTSSDNSIATVKDGVVTAVKAGKVTITASIGAVKAECTVEVKAASVPVDNNNGNTGNNGGTNNTTDTTKPVQIVNDTTKVVDAIKTAPEKSTVVVDAKNNATASKDIFTSIKGKDVNVTFQRDGIAWTFNGKDIDPTLIKDIDLSLKTVSADLKTKEAAKVKAIVGKDVVIVPFSFTYDGKLPGKATVKVFIGKDWANTSVYVNRYYADKNTYEIVQEATVDADGYMTFTTDHCSDYFVMAKSAAPNLPKTGSPIDMNVVVGMGSLVALLGAALFISGRKREENDIAA